MKSTRIGFDCVPHDGHTIVVDTSYVNDPARLPPFYETAARIDPSVWVETRTWAHLRALPGPRPGAGRASPMGAEGARAWGARKCGDLSGQKTSRFQTPIRLGQSVA
jgi:hypothetical protein